jgi:hypothetical protein
LLETWRTFHRLVRAEIAVQLLSLDPVLSSLCFPFVQISINCAINIRMSEKSPARARFRLLVLFSPPN